MTCNKNVFLPPILEDLAPLNNKKYLVLNRQYQIIQKLKITVKPLSDSRSLNP